MADEPTIDSGASGSDELTLGLMNQISNPPVVVPDVAPIGTPEPKLEEPKVEPVKVAEPAKVAPKAPDKVVTPPAKPAVKAEPKEINADDPKLPAAELRRAYKELKAQSGQTLAQKQAAIDNLESQIREHASKRVWSADDEKAHSEASAKLKQLEANLYSRDYSQSPEFKEKFIAQFDRQYTRSLETVKGMTVKFADADGEPKERPATKADFDRVINAPLSERYRLAKSLFGEDAHVVAQFAGQLNDLDEQAKAAIEDKRKGWETEQSKLSETTANRNKEFQSLQKNSESAFADTYPEIFKDETDPEAKAALERGMKFIEESTSRTDFPIQEQAARAGLVKGMAVAFPVMLHRFNKVNEQNKALTAELEKLRGTDPGAGGEGGAGAKVDTDDGGTDSLADSIKALETR